MATRAEEWDLPKADVKFVPATPKLFSALAKAQAEMQNPAFDSTNPHFRSKFASLAAVRKAVIPVLAKHGIAVCQDLTTTNDNRIGCTTILAHESGEMLRFGPLYMPATKPDAQGFGSAATYARRYSLQSVAGVVGDDDDDANAASAPPKAVEQKVPNEVWQSLESAADQGRIAFEAAWKKIPKQTRDLIHPSDPARWEALKAKVAA